MKKHFSFTITILLIITHLTVYSQDYHVRIGFIGNSITFGATLTNPNTECYPAQLGQMLQEKYGDTCILENFAISSRTMLKHGDFPIWNDVEFRNAWKFAPEILLICLGTNDTKPQNWDLYGHEFYDDYRSMIDTFRIRNPYVQFLVCYPPPAFDVVWGINDFIIRHGVIPAIDSILDYSGATLVDFYTPLIDSVSLFPDFIHPNFRGSGAMARILCNTMMNSDIIHKTETGLTFVTSFETDIKSLAVGDSATLTWTTVNAHGASLNRLPVPVNGFVKVSPAETSVYKLVARGEKNTDSMKIEQMVYQPMLTRLMISPRSKKVFEGDTVSLTVTFIDQENNPIRDPQYTVFWSILEGDGTLINETANMADFVAGNAGKAVIEARVDSIYVKSTITIEPLGTGAERIPENNALTVFPNPAGDLLYIKYESNGLSDMQIQLIDLNGNLIKEENHLLTAAGVQSIAMKIKDLDPGTYLYKIEYAGTSYTGKVVVH